MWIPGINLKFRFAHNRRFASAVVEGNGVRNLPVTAENEGPFLRASLEAVPCQYACMEGGSPCHRGVHLVLIPRKLVKLAHRGSFNKRENRMVNPVCRDAQVGFDVVFDRFPLHAWFEVNVKLVEVVVFGCELPHALLFYDVPAPCPDLLPFHLHLHEDEEIRDIVSLDITPPGLIIEPEGRVEGTHGDRGEYPVLKAFHRVVILTAVEINLLYCFPRVLA